MRKEKRDSPSLVSDMRRKGGGYCPFIFIIPDPRPKSWSSSVGFILRVSCLKPVKSPAQACRAPGGWRGPGTIQLLRICW